jgi:hypothetical protein
MTAKNMVMITTRNDINKCYQLKNQDINLLMRKTGVSYFAFVLSYVPTFFVAITIDFAIVFRRRC